MASQLLSEEFAENIVTTARTATGDSLRSVTYFTRSDFDQLYLRDDLEQDADLMAFIGTERQDFAMASDGYSGTELGEYRYTLRVFENGYAVRIDGRDKGVLVTSDGMELRDFNHLASAVSATLEEWEGEI